MHSYKSGHTHKKTQIFSMIRQCTSVLMIMVLMTVSLLLFTGCSVKKSGNAATTDGTQAAQSQSTDTTVSGTARDITSFIGNLSDEDLSADNLTGFRIVCLPVGKGDAFILYTKNGTVLIDTGYDDDGDAIVAYLRNTLGIQVVDDMIITHYDKDHVGGADKIIDQMPVSNIVLNAFVKESSDVKELFDSISKQQISIIYPGYADAQPHVQMDIGAVSSDTLYTAQSYSFSLDQVNYTIYPCEQQQYDTKDSNNSSMIVTVSYGSNTFLFAGDAEGERMSEFLAKHDGEHYDFIKMPYHGGYFKEIRKLITSAAPQYAVITASDEEPADTDTFKFLQKRKVTYYLTQKGTVVFTSDGQSIKVVQ